MTGPLQIAIVAYGTAGQAPRSRCRATGIRVEVFEQAAELGPVGAGFLAAGFFLQRLGEVAQADRTEAFAPGPSSTGA